MVSRPVYFFFVETLRLSLVQAVHWAQEHTLLLYSQVSLHEFERYNGKKLNELQALSIGNDLVFCVESWLNPNYLNCELIPSSADFTIYRCDRKNRREGGVFLAVKNRLPSIRHRDLETDAEILACELRPDSRRKILAVIFYRPQDTDLEYLKQLKKTLLLASKAKFDQILVIGDFNLRNRLANCYGNSWGLSSQLFYQAGERQLLVAISRLSN